MESERAFGMQIAYLLGVGVDTLPAREKKATAAAPEATSVHIETSSRLQELISKGSVEEDAKARQYPISVLVNLSWLRI